MYRKFFKDLRNLRISEWRTLLQDRWKNLSQEAYMAWKAKISTSTRTNYIDSLEKITSPDI